MRYLGLSLLMGLTASTATLIPVEVQAQSFDYNRLQHLPTRPFSSDDVLSFYGDWMQNEGSVGFSNLNRSAPDAGHIGFRPGSVNTRYYAAGAEDNPDPTGATRSFTLLSSTGLSHFSNYLSINGINLSEIGIGFGVKSGIPVTKTWNLGEDKLGQDWFGSVDSVIEENIYRANPDEVELYLLYGTQKFISFSYSDIYFVSANDNPTGFFGNWNIFYNNPVLPFKEVGLNGLVSGLADAFLQDVAEKRGRVQIVSEHLPQLSEFSFGGNADYEIFRFSAPIQIRIVSVPEPSLILGFLALGSMGVISHLIRLKKSQ